MRSHHHTTAEDAAAEFGSAYDFLLWSSQLLKTLINLSLIKLYFISCVNRPGPELLFDNTSLCMKKTQSIWKVCLSDQFILFSFLQIIGFSDLIEYLKQLK